MENKTLIIVIALAVVLIGGFLYTSSSGAIVSAVGSSQIEAKPDKVSINLRAEGKGKTSQEAKDKHDEIIDELFVGLIRLGIDRKDIQSSGFRIYEEFDYKPGGRESKGFVASQDVVVKIEDFELVAEIVDSAIDSGVLVSYINFELSEERQNEYKARALKEASEDARIKAEATASGLGKNLGRIVSIQSEDFNYQPYRYFGAYDGRVASAEDTKAAVVNLDPRDLTVSASVRVQFKVRSF